MLVSEVNNTPIRESILFVTEFPAYSNNNGTVCSDFSNIPLLAMCQIEYSVPCVFHLFSFSIFFKPILNFCSRKSHFLGTKKNRSPKKRTISHWLLFHCIRIITYFLALFFPETLLDCTSDSSIIIIASVNI